MKSRLIHENEKEQFNSFLENNVKGHILQSYEWGEIKAKTGWQPLRLLIEEDNGEPVAAISILKRKIPVLNKAIFYAPRGPVLDLENAQILDFLLEEVKRLARTHDAIFLKIDPDVSSSNKDLQQLFKDKGFRTAEKGEGFEGIQPKYVFRLDISPDETELLSNMHQKTRYNIRLAGKKGVVIREGTTEEDLKTFYEILKITTERDKFLVRSYNYFKTMLDELKPKGYAKLFLGEYEGKAIAGTLMLIFGDKAWYMYGASSNEHRNVMPNYLIQWEMIKYAKSLGCTLYDFRGAPGFDVDENHYLFGLVKFKRGFNGVHTEFIGEMDLVYSPIHYWLWNTLEPIYQKNIRRVINLKKKLKGK